MVFLTYIRLHTKILSSVSTKANRRSAAPRSSKMRSPACLAHAARASPCGNAVYPARLACHTAAIRIRLLAGMRDTTAFDTPNPHLHTHVRALFISDVHLGTRTSQAGALLEFMKHVDADVIYLVGDIIDFWRVRRGPY